MSKIEHLKAGEGSISWLYLDTRGYVTVGVGNMLPNAERAALLPFVYRDTQTRALRQDIISAFEVVKSSQSGMLAYKYREMTDIRLPEVEIEALLNQRIEEFEIGLESEFSGYFSYPYEAQTGLLDMAFNLGLSGLIRKFPSFCKAVRNQDWQAAADECKRIGISDERNEETKELFESIA